MTRFLILIILISSVVAHADDSLWKDNKLTPEQPFPAKVRAVLIGWEGNSLLLEEVGGSQERLCIASVRVLQSIDYGVIQDTKAEEKVKEQRKKEGWVYISPGIDVNQFSWSIGAYQLGRIFGDEDILKKTDTYLANKNKQAKQDGAGQPAIRSESKSEGSQKPQPESLEPSPFSSVVAQGDVIVVTLPKVPRLTVKFPADEGDTRASKESEVFRLVPESSLRLFERHSGYLITPQIRPKPGIHIEFTFDGRSFRRGVTTKKYFVAAQEDKKTAEQDGTGQPATRPESKSDGNENPNPETEGRSR